MAADYRVLSKLEQVNGQHYRVSMSYAKGGVSYWDYSRYPSGYYISVTPVTIEDRGNGFISESSMLGDGSRSLVQESARFNRKAGEKLIPQAEEKAAEMIAALEANRQPKQEEALCQPQ